jgi:hypothetical protein
MNWLQACISATSRGSVYNISVSGSFAVANVSIPSSIPHSALPFIVAFDFASLILRSEPHSHADCGVHH